MASSLALSKWYLVHFMDRRIIILQVVLTLTLTVNRFKVSLSFYLGMVPVFASRRSRRRRWIAAKNVIICTTALKLQRQLKRQWPLLYHNVVLLLLQQDGSKEEELICSLLSTYAAISQSSGEHIWRRHELESTCESDALSSISLVLLAITWLQKTFVDKWRSFKLVGPATKFYSS